MRLLVVLVALLAVAVAPASGLTSNQESPDRLSALERDVVLELNRVRATRGLNPVRTVKGLRTSASGHSRAMLELGFFAHDSSDGTPFHDRIRRTYPDRGWDTWSVAETLLLSNGEIDARAVVSAWLASPPHRKVILSGAWHDAGVAALYRPSAPGYFGGAETIVVTADFGHRTGKRRSARAAP